MPEEPDYKFKVITGGGATHSKWEKESDATSECETANKRAEKLGIETRYEVKPI